jgi:ATP-dependent RNA helicase DDX10/DBP4
MFERQNQDIFADHYKGIVEHGDEKDDFSGAAAPADDDDFMAIKRRIPADGQAADIDEEGENGEIAVGRVVHLEGASQPIVIDSHRREKLLKSKKKVALLKDKGHKIVFDDDGNAHEMYELEDEDDFKAKGLPEEQRKAFIEQAAEVVKEADVEDKAAQKQKKKDKLRKRRDRERNEAAETKAAKDAEKDEDEDEDEDDYEGIESGSEGGFGAVNEDLLANFRADAELSDSEEEAPTLVEKKEKKWFQSDSEGEDEGRGSKKRKKAKKSKRDIQEPQTLEDMEAMAAGLLG